MDTIRQQVNVTIWMVAVRRKLAETTNPADREFLAKMYAELARRLPR